MIGKTQEHKLKPCPFCESSNISLEREAQPPSNRNPYKKSFIYYCKCGECGSTTGNYAGFRNQERAIEAWNTRAPLPKIEGLTEDLLKRAEVELDELILTDGKSFTMQVPSRPDKDTDLVLSKCIQVAEAYLKLMEEMMNKFNKLLIKMEQDLEFKSAQNLEDLGEFLSRNWDRIEEALQIAADPFVQALNTGTFKIGDSVRKKGEKGQWHGRIVGFYTTDVTPIGYAVESVFEKNSVQIYPENALEYWDGNLSYNLLPQWRPIETAPKDGTKVLCYAPKNDNASVKGARCEQLRADRYVTGNWHNMYPETPYTHWQPLPQPPNDG